MTSVRTTPACFNSTSARAKSALFYGNSFIENETAILLERVPGDDVLYFVDTVFEENGQDIENRAGNTISFDMPG